MSVSENVLTEAQPKAESAASIEHLLFITPPVDNCGAYGLHELYVSNAVDELTAMGISVSRRSMSDDDILDEILRVSKMEKGVVYGQQGGYNLNLNADNKLTRNIYDMLDIPVFGNLGDHPFASFMARRLDAFPEKGKLISGCKSNIRSFAKIHGEQITIEHIDRMPPLVTNYDDKSSLPLEEREIDILIPWGLHKFFQDQKPLKDKLSEFGAKALAVGGGIYKQAMSDFCTPVYDMFEEQTKAILGEAYRFNRNKTNIDVTWMHILHVVDFQVRLDRRLRLLLELFKTGTDKKIVITADPKMASIFPTMPSTMNVSWSGQMKHHELEELYKNSKMVLSCNPTFPDSVHERVRNAMHFGNCVISDKNDALQHHFKEGEDILFINNDASDIGDVINRPVAELNRIAENGSAVINSDFSRRSYYERILKVLSRDT